MQVHVPKTKHSKLFDPHKFSYNFTIQMRCAVAKFTLPFFLKMTANFNAIFT